jgi:CAAX amino terminal protease family.
MENNCKPETSFIYRIFLLLIILVSGLILTYGLFLAFVFVGSGFDTSLFSTQIATLSQDVSLLRLMQFLQSFCVFILPPFVLTRLYKENFSAFLQLKKPNIKPALLGMLSILFMIPLINVLVSWNAGMHLPEALHGVESWMRASEDAAEMVTKKMLQGTAWYDLVINLIIIAMLAGIGEEFFFRGLLQSIFGWEIGPKTTPKPDWAIHTTIWVVAFLFSAMHMQFYGFIPRLLLGAWFGYLLWWTGSIWVPVLAHFMNNAISTIAVFMQNKGLTSGDPDQIGLGENWWLCLLSIALLAVCAHYLRKGQKECKTRA